MKISDLKAEDVAAQIRAKVGNVSAVARHYGVSREALYQYIQAHPTLREEIDNARETMVDNAESQLNAAVLRGEPWAVKTVLYTQGRKRGYVQGMELSGPDGGPIQVQPVKRVEIIMPPEEGENGSA